MKIVNSKSIIIISREELETIEKAYHILAEIDDKVDEIYNNYCEYLNTVPDVKDVLDIEGEDVETYSINDLADARAFLGKFLDM